MSQPEMFVDRTDPRLVTLLGDPATHDGAPVERFETHISHVFVAGAWALKLKKAVRYPFLDFSSRALRLAAAMQEVVLNRRTAPTLYRGLAWVDPASGTLGPVIADPAEAAAAAASQPQDAEPVVVMAAFDPTRRLDRWLSRHPIGDGLVQAMAGQVAALHDQAERLPRPGAAQAMIRVVEDLVGTLRGQQPRMPAALVQGFADATLDRLHILADRLEARGLDGQVRRCHGDLHLGNIFLERALPSEGEGSAGQGSEGEGSEQEGRPVLFDAVEFNDAFAEIDILYDLAFLQMDLLHRGLDAAANRLTNRWLELTGDLGDLGLMAPMIATRAAIRAMVSGLGAGEDPAAWAAAAAYLHTATRVLERPAPRVVAVGGYSGAGKSTVARALAPALGPAPGAVILRSDRIRKQRAGIPDHQRLPPESYTPEASAAVFAEMNRLAAHVVASGVAVVLDGRHARPEEQAAAADLARAAGVPFTGLWLEADPDALRARIEARQGDISDATPSVLEAQLTQPPPATDWTRIDTRAEPEVVRDRVLAHLGLG